MTLDNKIIIGCWQLVFKGAYFSFTDEWDEEYDTVGNWNAPFPNERENSYAFGLLESWGQGDSYVAQAIQALILQFGEPKRVRTFKL